MKNIAKALRRSIRPALFVLAALFVADAVAVAATVGFGAGVWFTALLGLILGGIGWFWEKLRKKRLLSGLIAAAFLLLGIALLFLICYGCRDTVTYQENAVIVLGSGVKGETPTRQLAERLDRTVEYCRRNPDAWVVVTGGQGPDEDLPEAVVMERYLIEHGVSPDKILREETSLSTLQNLNNAKPILEERAGKDLSVAIISSRYHLARGVFLANRAGFSQVTRAGAAIDWYTVPPRYLRECAAWIKLIFVH